MNLEAMIAVGAFYAIVLFVGIWASRQRNDNNPEELFLAGRKLPLFVGVFTMTATWVGGGYVNGTAEAVYGSGFIWTQAPWGYAIALAIGGLFFAEKMRNRNYTTLLDPFEEKYGKKIASVLFIPALIGEIFWSAAILVALGTTFSTILGFDFQTSILISACFAILYTFLGGLWSVAYTDVIQLVFIAIGLAIALPFIMDNLGGIDQIWVQFQDKFQAQASFLPALSNFTGTGALGDKVWYWLDMSFLLMLGGIPWGVYFQRVLSCRNGKQAKRLSLYAAVGCLVMAIPPILIGMSGAVAGWAEAPDAPLVLPYVLKEFTPPLIAAIGLGAISAAVMSSVDSSILSISSMFVWNVYRPLIKPESSDRQLFRMTKISIVIVGALATMLALKVQSVYTLWYLCSDLVYVILFPQLVAVLFFKKVTKSAAVTGILVGLILRLGGGEPLFNLPAFIPYPMHDPDWGILFPFRTFAMLSAMLSIYVVSSFTGKESVLEGEREAVTPA
ncbi:MAG: sodium:solute symporter family protein [Oligoflexus sp.]